MIPSVPPTTPGWRRSGPLWRGYVRALTILPVAWWSLILAVLVGRLAPDHASVGAWIAGACALVSITLMFIVIPAIVLLARPQRLIPRAVRGQPGAVTEWRDAGRTGPVSRRAR
jgi:fumarate reductase subunit C